MVMCPGSSRVSSEGVHTAPARRSRCGACRQPAIGLGAADPQSVSAPTVGSSPTPRECPGRCRGAARSRQPRRRSSTPGAVGIAGSVPAMSVVRTLVLFAVAAIAEIGGAWLVWQGVREHRGAAWVGAGIAALGAYGFVATLQEEAHFGRIL